MREALSTGLRQPEVCGEGARVWRELKVPYVCERYIGFSVPRGREFWAVSYEGIHRLRIDSDGIVTLANYTGDRYAEGGEYYDSRTSVLRFAGKEMRIVGRDGSRGISGSPSGESLVLLSEVSTLRVADPDGAALFEYRYVELSGDWAVATFTHNWQHILVGLPYDLHVLQHKTGAVASGLAPKSCG